MNAYLSSRLCPRRTTLLVFRPPTMGASGDEDFWQQRVSELRLSICRLSLSLSHLSLAWNTATAASMAETDGGLAQQDTMVVGGAIPALAAQRKEEGARFSVALLMHVLYSRIALSRLTGIWGLLDRK